MIKLITTVISFCLISASLYANIHTVTTVGSTYSPNSLNANIGDTIVFSASSTHPLVQVSQATWDANGKTELAGGWGTKTSNYTHVISAAGDIYYVCKNHVAGGMKGKVTVSDPSGVYSQKPINNELNFISKNIHGDALVKLEIGKTSTVSIKLFDITGQEISTLLEPTKMAEGKYTYIIETVYLNSGVYFVQANISGQVYTKKACIVR